MTTQLTWRRTVQRTGRQRSLRSRLAGLSLEEAVRSAVTELFGFSHRSSNAKALWSESERVWLGQETYLHWALRDDQIDIPWVVAPTADAPDDAEGLERAVRQHLVSEWDRQTSDLPHASDPHWLPLP